MIEQLAGLSIQGRCFSQPTSFRFFTKPDERLSLVYGSNGSGKSTISRAFGVLSSKETSDLTVHAVDISQRALLFPSAPAISVFNEDYIDANVRIDDDGLGSIVLLGEQVELEAQITAAQAQLDAATQDLSVTSSKLAPFLLQNNVSSPMYHRERIKSILRGTSQWAQTDSRIKGHRQNTSVTESVVDEICNLNVTETLEQLKADFEAKQKLLEQTASNNPAYSAAIHQVSIDPQLEDRLISILAQKISEPVLTERENLILRMVQEGRQHTIEDARRFFSESNSDFCPYCLQRVTQEHKTDLLNSILLVFNKDVDMHKAQLAEIQLVDLPDIYMQYADLDNQLVNTIRQLISEYNQLLAQYRVAIQTKADNIYSPIIQPKLGICDRLAEINTHLQVLEQKRSEFVTAVRKRTSIVNELILINKKIASLFCRDSFSAYQKQLKEQQSLEAKQKKQESALEHAKTLVQSLLAKKKWTVPRITNNRNLHAGRNRHHKG